MPSRAFGPLIDSLDLKQIRCFVAAYEEGSFSKAALREHCTQPGLSVYIQRLETRPSAWPSNECSTWPAMSLPTLT